jgi:DNA replication protein DnaC
MGDGMSDPKPMSADLFAVMGALKRISAKVEVIEKEPDFAARVAKYEAAESLRQEHELQSLCDERDVPAEPGIRSVCMQLFPKMNTVATSKVANLLAVRSDINRSLPKGSRQPIALVLSGPPGCGKTTAMSWAVAQHKRFALYVRASEIAATPDTAWSENQLKRQRWRRADLLAIDELGHDSGGNGAELIGALLSERHDLGGMTICATNIDLATFLSRYVNDRLRSRLAYGPDWWCELSDNDLRNPANRHAMGGLR